MFRAPLYLWHFTHSFSTLALVLFISIPGLEVENNKCRYGNFSSPSYFPYSSSLALFLFFFLFWPSFPFVLFISSREVWGALWAPSAGAANAFVWYLGPRTCLSCFSLCELNATWKRVCISDIENKMSLVYCWQASAGFNLCFLSPWREVRNDSMLSKLPRKRRYAMPVHTPSNVLRFL